MLSVREIETCYGATQVLFKLSLDVQRGEIVTLLGRNGMGKTTAIRSVMGQLKPQSGTIEFDGHDIAGWEPYKVARTGIGLAPEGRRIFPNLTTLENMVAASNNDSQIDDPWDTDKILELFPALKPRVNAMAGTLSGGEQQMLSISRALMTNPKLLLLDEATEGLSPLLREQIWQSIATLKANRQSILLIDKNLEPLLRIGDRHYIVEKGQVVWFGDSNELKANRDLHQRYIGI